MADDNDKKDRKPSRRKESTAPFHEDYSKPANYVGDTTEANRPGAGWRQGLAPRLAAQAAQEEIDQARSSIRAGEYADAKARLQKVLQGVEAGGDPNRQGTEGSALSVLGTALDASGEHDAAVEAFGRAVALLQGLSVARLSPIEASDYGIALAGLGRKDEAFEVLRATVDKEGATPEAYRAVGLFLAGRGALDEAVLRLKTAFDMAPSDIETKVSLASVLERLLRTDEAVQAYTEAGFAFGAVGRFDRATYALGRALALGPETPDLLVGYGEMLRLQGRGEEALQSLRRGLSLGAEGSDVRVNIALVLDAQGDHTGALAELEKALEDEPRSPIAMGVRGMIFSETGELEEARRELTAAVTDDPTLAWAHIELAEVLRQLDLPEDAVAAAGQALALMPDDVRALGIRGAALATLERTDEALETVNRALAQDSDYAFGLGLKGSLLMEKEEFEAALSILLRAVELDPSFIWARSELAEDFRRLGRFQEAIATADQVLAVAPDDVRTLGTKGDALRSLGQAQQALEVLDRAITLNPKWLFGLRAKAMVLFDEDRIEEGSAALQRALELDPDDAMTSTVVVELAGHGHGEVVLRILDRVGAAEPDSAMRWITRGMVTSVLGRETEAEQSYSHALELDPDNVQALWGRGESLRLIGRLDEASDVLYRALRLAPSDPWVEVGILQSTGYALIGLERYAEAISTFQRAVALTRTAISLADLALAYRRGNEYDQALVTAGQAVELAPTDRWALLNRGQICNDIAEFEAAIEDLQTVVTQDSGDAEAQADLGWAFHRLGRGSEALDAYTAAWNADRDDLWARKGVAEALRQIGDSEKAIGHYQAVVHAAEQDAVGASQDPSLTAWCCYRLGRFDDAFQLMRKARSALPDVAIQFDLALVLLCSGEHAAAVREYRRGVDQAQTVHPLRQRGYIHIALMDLREAISEHPDVDDERIRAIEAEMAGQLAAGAT
jgi:tetratricopeptide (TPR) repeat protein